MLHFILGRFDVVINQLVLLIIQAHGVDGIQLVQQQINNLIAGQRF